MSDQLKAMPGLRDPPSEIEIAELLQGLACEPSMQNIARRLILQRDTLKYSIIRYHAARDHFPRAVNEGTSEQASAAAVEVKAAREAMYRAAGVMP